jgi:phenylalanyl-tRNA synthetase beta chain
METSFIFNQWTAAQHPVGYIMPTLSVSRDLLFEKLEKVYTDEEFDELCFEFGIELDEIVQDDDDAVVKYKIDLPANRYDLLCVEGLARALRIFAGTMNMPVYQSLPPLYTMWVNQAAVSAIRPYVVCAVLRDVDIGTAARYTSLMDLQDQLHRNLCRHRTLVAIGTHDLDAITTNYHGPVEFYYDARTPSAISFVPLTPNDCGEFTADKLLEFYETDPSCKHLKPYVSIIQDAPRYPVVLAKTDQDMVLSLPPIINGNHSKISTATKNIFIECTATDLTKANIVLDTIVCMFSEYCAKPYTAEQVTVKYYKEEKVVVNEYTTPLLSTRTETASVQFCNSMIGIQLDAREMANLCHRVQLGPAQVVVHESQEVLQVTVPPTRSDILHAVDIAEDIGIAHGYNHIVKRIPRTNTVGAEQSLNHVTDLLRQEIAASGGYMEMLTHGLCSLADNYTNLRQGIDTAASVALSNPANIEYQIVRTTLLPGLFKTLQHNKSASFAAGFKIFEISDVVLADGAHYGPVGPSNETRVGARNERHVAAMYAGPSAGFEIIHGLVDRIMTLLEIAPSTQYIAMSSEDTHRIARQGWFYQIAELDASMPAAGTFFPGRAAEIRLTTPATQSTVVGTFGIVHPEVLNNFDIHYPTSCMELNLEALV